MESSLSNILDRLPSVKTVAMFVAVSVLLSSCVVDYQSGERERGRMDRTTFSLFSRYMQSPLDYMRVALMFDRYLSLPDDEKKSSDYDFIRESYEVNGDVHTVLGCSFTMKGGSIWNKDAVWGSDLGMTIVKADADSTWILSVKGDNLESCTLTVKLISPMTMDKVETESDCEGKYVSGELEAGFTSEGLVSRWARTVSYTYVQIESLYTGDFDVVFMKGKERLDWSKLSYHNSTEPVFSSSWDNM